MMDKMKAIVMRGPGQYGLETVERPAPGPGEVLVRVRAVAICGSDPKVFSGDYQSIGWPPAFPFTPGHEFAGEVAALGAGVTGLEPGDRVAGEAHCGCGVCDNCKAGLYNLCLNYGKPESGHRHYGFIAQGAYAEYGLYNPKALTKMPHGLSFEEGAMADTAGTSLQAVRLAGITPGGTSLIVGPGPIGIFAMQLARAMGASTIMVGRGARLQLAGRLGADELVDYEGCDDIVAEVRRLTGGAGVDEAFECAGSAAAMGQCIRSVKKNGNVAFVSLPAQDEHPIPVKTMVMNQIHLHGSRANPSCTKAVLRMMASGAINARDMVTHTFPLEQFSQALDTFVQRRGGAMKVVLKP